MQALSVDHDIEKASTISSSFYTSQQWFDISREKIFARSWQFCLSADDLRQVGQMVPFTILPGVLDEPILFVRDTADVLYCLSNVCTHRGNLLVDGPCVSNKIRCRYHGRRFSLCGDFIHMPEFEKAKDFPSKKDNLPRVPFDQLGKFIFSSVAPVASFHEVFAEIKTRLAWQPFSEFRYDPNRSRDYLVKAHWALYCENYLEGLHIPFVHPSLRSVLDYGNYTTEVYRYCSLQLGLANSGEDAFELPPDAVDYGKRVAAYYYWIFPNTMLNFYPWGCSVNVIKPLGPSLTRVSFLTYILDESKMDRGAGAELDKVEREDEAVVETVQKGIRSRFYDSGRYSPTREQGTHHFHRLLCEFLNE
jgi:choline monooxygenase